MAAGRLTWLNVGRPKDVAWQGRTVHTGIWKSPVTGPRMVRRLNIDGDGQGDLAGHGGEMRAVLVYQLASYRHWERELHRTDFVPGQFGENFTVEGLADDEVCIGDRYRIGGALFEVTQPRVTCYRVGLRMEEPRMPSLLVAHGRPGFYLRVLEEGEVAAGQDIVRVAEGPGRLTVAEVDAMLYRGRHSREALERALAVEALSPGWRASFEALLRQDSPAAGNVGLTAEAGAPPPAWGGFRPLAVTRIDEESRGVRSLWLAAPDGASLPAAAPGQYLTLRLDPAGGKPPLVRSYSLSGRPGDAAYRISVKREPHGAAGEVLHTQVRVGDRLQVAAPRGTFTLADGTGPVVLASAGVGATPLLAMLSVLAETRSDREVWWLHGAHDGGSHVFAAESRQLLARLPRVRVRICYSRPRPEDRAGADFTDTGHLDGAVLARAGVPADAEAYLCGPVAFMADLAAALAAQGVDQGRIHTEIFGTTSGITPGIAAAQAGPPHAPPGPAGTGPAVTFVRSGLTVPWDRRHGTLLELAEACDVPVRWSCRTGVCHTCETGLLSGDVAYDPEPLDPPAGGNALICCSRPARDVVLDL
jgi:ferredoxin-NADP reductase/MOSC domain-containing protein YiiM/ferredoxin